MSTEQTVQTPEGVARLWIDDAPGARLRLVLGHGAGGGIAARDLAALADRLPEQGITVVRVEQPYRVAGKRLPPRPPVLDRAWAAVLEAVPRDLPVVVGGRSSGARVACRTAQAVGAAAVVALSFPLHPPGKPERSRLPELLDAGVPTLVVQGERDTFGRPDEFPDGPFSLRTVAHADHGLSVPKAHSQAAATESVVAAVREFIEPLLG
ncbi:alpha/beta family hydrolase [Phytoactinopolyspora mesophila]|uniref:Hydrolase n=1 Tax=Phytoactinopolyspora mesophila TaxID=2650750 RepID=A0A7K3M9V7_9ACTN|nr:alpha/beta family hydrolase [Phytoactinopolyspora mesophila]NDL60046.1 hydrolase [Phytoactinopolyspora mesophila]